MKHYLVYPSSNALCGDPRGPKGFGTVLPEGVTCQECMALLIEQKLAEETVERRPILMAPPGSLQPVPVGKKP